MICIQHHVDGALTMYELNYMMGTRCITFNDCVGAMLSSQGLPFAHHVELRNPVQFIHASEHDCCSELFALTYLVHMVSIV